jgi:hypothetical protein
MLVTYSESPYALTADKHFAVKGHLATKGSDDLLLLLSSQKPKEVDHCTVEK